MTDSEIKEAFKAQCPVESGGIVYQCISALICRIRGGKIVMTAELLDKSRNSVTITDCTRVNPVADKQ